MNTNRGPSDSGNSPSVDVLAHGPPMIAWHLLRPCVLGDGFGPLVQNNIKWVCWIGDRLEVILAGAVTWNVRVIAGIELQPK
jgi:hypothetical protein